MKNQWFYLVVGIAVGVLGTTLFLKHVKPAPATATSGNTHQMAPAPKPPPGHRARAVAYTGKPGDDHAPVKFNDAGVPMLPDGGPAKVPPTGPTAPTLKLDQPLSGVIGNPKSVPAPFVSQFYRFHAHNGETVTFKVTAKDPSKLTPLLGISQSQRGGLELREIKQITGTKGVATITETFPADGVFIISVDDVRNLPTTRTNPAHPHYFGGPDEVFSIVAHKITPQK